MCKVHLTVGRPAALVICYCQRVSITESNLSSSMTVLQLIFLLLSHIAVIVLVILRLLRSFNMWFDGKELVQNRVDK